MASKKRAAKPPAPIMPHGKKRKKTAPGLGPGVHHADHSKQKSFPVTAVTSPVRTAPDVYAAHTNRSARVHPPPSRA
jgi:hypothetical protein